MNSVTRLVRSLGSIAALGLASAAFTALVKRKVEAELPPLGRFVDIDGTRLHVVEQGSGAPIVLIHGLGGELRHFTYALLERLANDHRVIAIDRPGAGYSTRRHDDASRLDQQARIIHAFISRERLESPMIVGHSLGGTVALRLALDHPHSVGGLVLLAPLTRSVDVPFAFQMVAPRYALLRRLMAWTVATPMNLLAGRKVVQWIFSPQAPPVGFATRGGGLQALRPSHFYTTSLDLVAVNRDLPPMEGRYGQLSMPVGVLYGSADNVLDPWSNLLPLASRLPGIEVELLEGAGHMLPLTHPEETAAFIRRCAMRLPGGRRPNEDFSGSG